jgi:DNA-binding MarR family transcriptional regulator
MKRSIKTRRISRTVGFRRELVRLVGRFLSEMHRHDAGRTLPLLHLARLNTPQLAVLEFVRAPRTVSAIADHIGLSLPATSQLVNKLVRRRLVRRSEGTTDRRQKNILLNNPGAQWLERIEAGRVARFEASLALLPTHIAARLAQALAESVAAMDNDEAPVRKANRKPRSRRGNSKS